MLDASDFLVSPFGAGRRHVEPEVTEGMPLRGLAKGEHIMSSRLYVESAMPGMREYRIKFKYLHGLISVGPGGANFQ